MKWLGLSIGVVWVFLIAAYAERISKYGMVVGLATF
jgi:hypothetical protein